MPSVELTVLGLGAGVLAVLAALLSRRLVDPLRVLPLTTAVVLVADDQAPLRVLIAGLAIVVASRPGPSLLSWLLAAVVLASALPDLAGEPETWWFLLTALVLVPRSGAGQRPLGTPLAAVLLVITAAGVYAGPPDTEQITVVGAAIGVAATYLVVARPEIEQRSTTVAGVALVVLWAALVGAEGRPASFWGAVACFGVLASHPGFRRRQANLWAAAGLVVVQAGAALIGARVIAPRTDVSEAFLLAVGTLVATGIAVFVVSRTAPQPA